jgi:hypothetical protein
VSATRTIATSACEGKLTGVSVSGRASLRQTHAGDIATTWRMTPRINTEVFCHTSPKERPLAAARPLPPKRGNAFRGLQPRFAITPVEGEVHLLILAFDVLACVVGHQGRRAQAQN